MFTDSCQRAPANCRKSHEHIMNSSCGASSSTSTFTSPSSEGPGRISEPYQRSIFTYKPFEALHSGVSIDTPLQSIGSDLGLACAQTYLGEFVRDCVEGLGGPKGILGDVAGVGGHVGHRGTDSEG